MYVCMYVCIFMCFGFKGHIDLLKDFVVFFFLYKRDKPCKWESLLYPKNNINEFVTAGSVSIQTFAKNNSHITHQLRWIISGKDYCHYYRFTPKKQVACLTETKVEHY